MKKVVQGIEKLLENHNLKSLDPNNKPIEFDFPLEEFGKEGNLNFGGKLPWERDERMVFRRTKKDKVITVAEMSLDADLLLRLRGEAAKMRKWVKVKKAGVIQAVVDQIHFIWKNNELAMLKFDLPLCRNMDRAREIVEVEFAYFLLLFLYLSCSNSIFHVLGCALYAYCIVSPSKILVYTSLK